MIENVVLAYFKSYYFWLCDVGKLCVVCMWIYFNNVHNDETCWITVNGKLALQHRYMDE